MESGAFEIGFERAGITTVLQAEKDAWCLEVLARHWPGTERVTDVRCVTNAYESGRRGQAGQDTVGIDLIYGGFPCQDLSVAGKRAGLGGERSNLWFEFRRVVSELRPRYVVVENVPGLHSSSAGEDFTVIASGLVELGYGVAWRILNAQFFGVAQRRRRVFIVAARDADGRAGAERAAQVLALCESCGGNPETGRAPGEGVAYALAASVRGTGDGHGNVWNSNYVANPLGAHHRRDDLDHDTYIASPITASAGHHGHSSPRGDGSDNLIVTPFDTTQITSAGNYSNPQPGDPMHPLAAGAHPPAIAVRTAQTGSNGWGVGTDELAYTLDGAQGQAVVASTLQAKKPTETRIAENILPLAAGVRRLTPRECERLQGWPDDHTRWTADGREIADSHRFRMIGNGVASPCAEWIGHRLMAVDGLSSGA